MLCMACQEVWPYEDVVFMKPKKSKWTGQAEVIKRTGRECFSRPATSGVINNFAWSGDELYRFPLLCTSGECYEKNGSLDVEVECIK
jgi:hypothetical protein